MEQVIVDHFFFEEIDLILIHQWVKPSIIKKTTPQFFMTLWNLHQIVEKTSSSLIVNGLEVYHSYLSSYFFRTSTFSQFFIFNNDNKLMDYIIYFDNGEMILKRWHHNGQLYNRLIYEGEILMKMELWNSHGIREAYFSEYKDGNFI